MNPRTVTMWNRLPTIAALTVAALCTMFAGEAWAACFTTGKNPVAAPRAQLGSVPRAQLASASGAITDSSTSDSIVGMWHSVFLLGNGPNRYDESFQQFHAGGTEMMLSNGLPPALGNVCVGVWTETGNRTFKLRHMAWNWNPDGSFAGTFEMVVTPRIDRRGDNLAGTWAADSTDPSGNVIPELHAEGVVRSTRITAE